MRAAWFGVLALVGCGGDADDGTEGCTEAAVEVTVTDEGGAAVTGAEVALEDIVCAESDAGVYSCTAPNDAEIRLYVTKSPDFEPHAQTLTIDAGVCDLPVEVVLSPAMVY